MSKPKYHTIADDGAAVDVGREAALTAAAPSTQPLTSSDTGDPPPPTMSESNATVPLTASDINPAPAEVPVQSGDNQQDLPQAGPVAVQTNGDRGRGVLLCRHIKADGVFCQVPAVGGRRYCYNHLRLRGQQMRIARALARREPYQLMLPALEDMNAVQAALNEVTAAVAAGLVEHSRAKDLLNACQQAANNLRFIDHLAEKAARQASAVEAGEPQRVVEEYPGFEAEFELPAGAGPGAPPQVAFPPAEKATGWAAALTTPQEQPRDLWTKEAIELEELEERRDSMSEKDGKRAKQLNDMLWKRATGKLRKQQEAEWEAKAAQRNAEEAEKARRYKSMDEGQRRAFHEGVLSGIKAAEQQQRTDAARAKNQQRRGARTMQPWPPDEAEAKKPAATVGGEPAAEGLSEGNKAVADKLFEVSKLPGKSLECSDSKEPAEGEGEQLAVGSWQLAVGSGSGQLAVVSCQLAVVSGQWLWQLPVNSERVWLNAN